jgi:hypothetical protein
MYIQSNQGKREKHYEKHEIQQQQIQPQSTEQYDLCILPILQAKDPRSIELHENGDRKETMVQSPI